MKLFSFQHKNNIIDVIYRDDNQTYYFNPATYSGSYRDLWSANSLWAVYAIMENNFEIDMDSWWAEKYFKDDLNEIINCE